MIEISSSINNGKMEVYNVLGEKVVDEPFNNTSSGKISIDLSFLKNGVYYITLSNSKERYFIKTIKN